MATKPLLQETLAQRSLIFARLAQIAYDEPAEAKKQARKLGFTTVEFYDRSGAQNSTTSKQTYVHCLSWQRPLVVYTKASKKK